MFLSILDEALLQYFDGSQVFVLVLQTNWTKEDWLPFANILKWGYRKLGYWPVRLAKAFGEMCLFQSTDEKIKRDSFMQYIVEASQKLLTDMAKVFDDDKTDELDDLLTASDRMMVQNS